MSLFNRIARVDEPKIPIWPFINYFTLVLDSERTITQMAAEFDLDANETTELGKYLTAMGGIITAGVTRRVTNGVDATTAEEDARAFAFTRAWQALARAENGYITESEMKTIFGVS